MLKLHLACGVNYIEGWYNIDIDAEKVDKKHDLREALPFDDNMVDFIFHEHFLEHLAIEEGLFFLAECRRVLKPGGVMRVSVPSLNYIMFRYFFFWKKQSWIKDNHLDYLQNRAEMINMAFRDWGHKHMYNGVELRRRLKEVGFTKIEKRKIRKSKHPELNNLESRKESWLVMEVTK